MEKVINIKENARVEDEDYVKSKEERKAVEANKAPTVEKGVDPSIEYTDENREEVNDSDLEKPVHAVATSKNRK
jgi:hypothetical protein